ncbi:unknown [[Mannheimia] succiniciproducens MBEL55E]|uniref:Uncharacterized protein n=1 Tax=Mannheimia succiniciproducens (strain KCTC 0769BP / MBEL55E) TaxID=221988 RepID=Q65VV4_MANSM|nr:unknown [[Mannheimia] succiniciproducens MBEL55E]
MNISVKNRKKTTALFRNEKHQHSRLSAELAF